MYTGWHTTAATQPATPNRPKCSRRNRPPAIVGEQVAAQRIEDGCESAPNADHLRRARLQLVGGKPHTSGELHHHEARGTTSWSTHLWRRPPLLGIGRQVPATTVKSSLRTKDAPAVVPATRGIGQPRGIRRPEAGAVGEAQVGGNPSSMAAMTALSVGLVAGANRVIDLPSAETTNFSKFQRMSPAWPLASATGVSSS